MTSIDVVFWVVSFLAFRGMVISWLGMRWTKLASSVLRVRIDSGRYHGDGIKDWPRDLDLLNAIKLFYCLPRLWIWTVNSAISHLPRAVELRDEAIQLARIRNASQT